MYFYTILSKHLNRAKTELLVSKRQDEVNYELHFKYIEAIEKYINKKNDYNKFDFAEFKKSDRHQRIIRFYKNNFKSNEKLKNISSLAFGGDNLKTGYLGCLLDQSIYSFASPYQGHAPAHWNFKGPKKTTLQNEIAS